MLGPLTLRAVTSGNLILLKMGPLIVPQQYAGLCRELSRPSLLCKSQVSYLFCLFYLSTRQQNILPVQLSRTLPLSFPQGYSPFPMPCYCAITIGVLASPTIPLSQISLSPGLFLLLSSSVLPKLITSKSSYTPIVWVVSCGEAGQRCVPLIYHPKSSFLMEMLRQNIYHLSYVNSDVSGSRDQKRSLISDMTFNYVTMTKEAPQIICAVSLTAIHCDVDVVVVVIVIVSCFISFCIT